jgi:hypothetical protein
MSDDQIITRAKKERRIILTHDKDFGNLLRYPLKKHGGVILIRLGDQSPNNVTRLVIPLLKKLAHKCPGALIVIKDHAVRILKNQTEQEKVIFDADRDNDGKDIPAKTLLKILNAIDNPPSKKRKQ